MIDPFILKNYEKYRTYHDVDVHLSKFTKLYTVCCGKDCNSCVLSDASNCGMMGVSDKHIEALKQKYPEDFV